MQEATGDEEGVVAIHGAAAQPLSLERVEVRTVAVRARQALEAFTHVAQDRTPDPAHDEMRSDLEMVERVLTRWDPGRV